MDNTFIKVENLSFAYETEDGKEPIEILHGINFEVERGQFVAILGRNGSGKSTFAKLLNMILTPNTGKITIDGIDITNPDMDEQAMIEVRRRIGMVFQNPDNQLVATIVEEDIAFGPENLGVPSQEIRERVDKALETVGMTEYSRHSPARLSGGQKQRIAIAGILAMQPKCIIFDESTAMLDPQGRHDIMKTIDKLNKDDDMTILTITHNMEEAIVADRVVIMDGGKIVMDGTPEEVFSCVDELHTLGLGVPQASELVHLLKKDGHTLPDGIISEDKAIDAIANILG